MVFAEYVLLFEMRAFDLNAFENGNELYAGLKDYFAFYNRKRPHQSLDYQQPEKTIKKLHKYEKKHYLCGGKTKKSFEGRELPDLFL
jgi:hypothetical protein